VNTWRTRWAERRQRILWAVGVTAPPEGLVQLRNKRVADAEGFNAHRRRHKSICGGEEAKVRRVHRPRHVGRETPKNLGGPVGSCEGEATRAGIRLWRHGRGNPATALGRNRSGDEETSTGRWKSTGTGEAHREPLGGLITRSTLSVGKPRTGGRT
jgi:hypothetical protein